MQKLLKILQSIGNIPNSETQRFTELAKRIKIARGHYFIQQGYGTNRLGFVERGLFRNTYVTQGGDEYTFTFTAENEFLFECKAMRTADVAHYSIQAIEDSTILALDYKTWVAPFEDSAWWNKILLDLTASESSLKNEREIMLMSLAGRERYAHFLEKYSYLEHRIKQHMVASYLGITSVSLSRIRREMGLIS